MTESRLKRSTFWMSSLAIPLVWGLFFYNDDAPKAMEAGDFPVVNDYCSPDYESFVHGEEIVYKLYYNWNFVWLAAGEMNLRVVDLGDSYYFKAVGKSYPSYEWFFRVHDIYESKVRKSDFKPIWTRRQVEEGKYRLYHEHWMDYKKGTARSLRGKTKEVAVEKVIPIKDCQHDLLSVVYFMRNSGMHTFGVNQNYPVELFIDDEYYPVKVIYKGVEKNKNIKGVGKLDVHKVVPELIVGDVFDEDTQMEIYVSKDNNRIPVLIESPLRVGSVKVVLKSKKNLKHPLVIR
jgi:hypothetical protein